MAQIFPRWTNAIPTYGVPAVLASIPVVIFIVYFWFSPKHTDVGYQPKQPIAYSHQLHAGTMEMDCRYCHYNVERGPHAGVPPTQVCMNCHATVKKDSALIAPLLKSWAEGSPIKWVRIHKAPDYVYFNHSAHVGVGVGENRAAIGCESCHGRVDLMAEHKVEQVMPLSMSWCLDCHDDPAPRLRPVEAMTLMGYQQPADFHDKARRIAKTLNPPGNRSGARVHNADGSISTHATAGCTGCHR